MAMSQSRVVLDFVEGEEQLKAHDEIHKLESIGVA